MQFLSEGYLRVTSPLTIDGSRPRYDEQGRMMYKETELPLTAKKHMERHNANLPDHLKMKIEVVLPDTPATVQPTAETPGTETREISQEMLVRKRFSTFGRRHLVKK